MGQFVKTPVTLVAFLALVTVSQLNGVGAEKEVACGPHSLALASDLLGREVLDGDLSSAFGNRLNGVHSLKEVATAAEHLGLTAQLVQLDPNSPNLEPLPLVALIKRTPTADTVDHFIVLYGRSGDLVQVLDYPEAPALVPVAELPRFWDGRGLYIVKSPSELPLAVRATPWLAGLTIGGGLLVAFASLYLPYRMSRQRRSRELIKGNGKCVGK